MKLGQFTLEDDGSFQGVVKAYGLPETTVMLVPKQGREGKPYYEIVGDPHDTAFDGGIGFPKEKGNLNYVSLSLDSPIFPAPLSAALFPDKQNPALHNLVWDRPEPKPAPSADATPTQGRRYMGANVAP